MERIIVVFIVILATLALGSSPSEKADSVRAGMAASVRKRVRAARRRPARTKGPEPMRLRRDIRGSCLAALAVYVFFSFVVPFTHTCRRFHGGCFRAGTHISGCSSVGIRAAESEKPHGPGHHCLSCVLTKSCKVVPVSARASFAALCGTVNMSFVNPMAIASILRWYPVHFAVHPPDCTDHFVSAPPPGKYRARGLNRDVAAMRKVKRNRICQGYFVCFGGSCGDRNRSACAG